MRLQQESVSVGNIHAIQQHYDENPGDKLCHIYRPNDNAMIMCRRSGTDAIHRIARRLVSAAPNSADLSIEDVSGIISHNILQFTIDGSNDEAELYKTLQTYVLKSEEKHETIAYHFACVLVHEVAPSRFCLGPVSFRRCSEFIVDLERKKMASEIEIEEEPLQRFKENAEKYGWVASIGIPKCAPAISMIRAERTVQTAINILKVFIGLRHSKTMRLPHVVPASNRETFMLIQKKTNLTWRWQGQSLQGALVGDNWLDQIPPGYRHDAARLLFTCIRGERSEIANRVIDAIQWFGDASFELMAGVQIIKWVAGLERLTTTARFNTHTFCMRVAFLAAESTEPAALERTYRLAREAYALRCDIMHGSTSQEEYSLNEQTMNVHDLIQTALFRGMEIHHFLDSNGTRSDVNTINTFYCNEEFRFSALFEKLRVEYRNKKT
jgi:hypothetical protein